MPHLRVGRIGQPDPFHFQQERAAEGDRHVVQHRGIDAGVSGPHKRQLCEFGAIPVAATSL